MLMITLMENGRRSILEVEPQNFATYNSRPNSSHFDNGYIGEFNGNRYYLETTGWNWSTHNSYANSAGGYLFVPNTKEEWDWMMSRLQSVSNGQWHYAGVYQVNNSDYSSDQIRGGWDRKRWIICAYAWGINGDGTWRKSRI